MPSISKRLEKMELKQLKASLLKPKPVWDLTERELLNIISGVGGVALSDTDLRVKLVRSEAKK